MQSNQFIIRLMCVVILVMCSTIVHVCFVIVIVLRVYPYIRPQDTDPQRHRNLY